MDRGGQPVQKDERAEVISLSTEERQWTKFERATHYEDNTGTHPLDPDDFILRNNIYQVSVVEINRATVFGKITWLSIKRIDQQPIHDWRDLQRIKNELVGELVEAVELYPSEARLVDICNQYHLWCFVDGYRFPFGYRSRLVIEEPDRDGLAVQRPWDDTSRPKDLMEPIPAEKKA